MKFQHRLRTKLIIAFILITLIPVLITGLYAIQTSTDTLRRQALATQQEQAQTLKARVESFLATTRADLSFLSQSVPFVAYMQAREQKNIPGEVLKAARQEVEREFIALSLNRAIYYQMRYLDETGMEVVRVDTQGNKSRVISEGRLQNKAERYYFKDTMRLQGGNILVSPLDLNRERGKVEVPHKPVIRYAMKVYTRSKKPAGIIITNVDAKQFLRLLGDARLVLPNGFFARHPQGNRRWGGPTDLGTGYDIKKEYPELAERILSSTDSISTDELTISQAEILVPGSNKHWRLIIQDETPVLLESVFLFRITFFIILGISIIAALALALFFSYSITRPIEHLTNIANNISKGKQLTSKVSVNNKGEIGQLAESFDRMRVSMVKAMQRLRKKPTQAS